MPCFPKKWNAESTAINPVICLPSRLYLSLDRSIFPVFIFFPQDVSFFRKRNLELRGYVENKKKITWTLKEKRLTGEDKGDIGTGAVFPESWYLQKLGIKGRVSCWYVSQLLTLSLKVQSLCFAENELRSTLMMILISCYLEHQRLYKAAITPVISMHPVMLDCMKVTWCTNQILFRLDLYLLNRSASQWSSCCVHLQMDYLDYTPTAQALSASVCQCSCFFMRNQHQLQISILRKAP